MLCQPSRRWGGLSMTLSYPAQPSKHWVLAASIGCFGCVCAASCMAQSKTLLPRWKLFQLCPRREGCHTMRRASSSRACSCPKVNALVEIKTLKLVHAGHRLLGQHGMDQRCMHRGQGFQAGVSACSCLQDPHSSNTCCWTCTLICSFTVRALLSVMPTCMAALHRAVLHTHA